MSVLWPYALVDAAPRLLPPGLAGEPLRIVRARGLQVVVGELDAAPPADEAGWKGHDAAVRRLCAACAAVLPIRFGGAVASHSALVRALAPQRDALAEGLATVRGCEQMTLRVFARGSHGAAPTPAPAPPPPDAGGGPGETYLRARARSYALPELGPLRAALQGLLRAERVEPAAQPPLLASVYHLIARGQAAAYADAVRTVSDTLPVRVTLSGPWPAYAFAPEVPA
ncbi:MAG TPA: GvpL/GvpF family gas vesicle protein [Polyangia bacterium]|nr:GvpL/GvpF family gas vesicle protein [Polyangia bacterium]